MGLTTKQKIFITSGLVPLVFIFLTIFEFNLPFYKDNRVYIVPGILAFIEAAMVAWVVDFKLKGERIFTVMVFPGLALSIFVAFLGVVVRTSGNELSRVSSLLVFSIILGAVTYVLTANINILNLSATTNIPLGQAARAAHYVLTLVFSYFAFVLLISWNLPFFIKPFVVFALVFIFTFVALWTISLAYSHRFISSLGIGVLLTFAYLVFSMWPLESFYYALFLALIYYMALGVALEIREIINSWIWYEYAAIFFAMFIILLATANWGVNGTIF